MLSTALSDAVLCLSSALALYLVVQRHNASEADRPAALGAMVGFLGFVLAALFGSLRFGLGEQWAEVHSLFSQVATYMSLPLIATAFLCLSLPWSLSRPGWGRTLLGLMVAFEVARRLEWGAEYRLLLGGLSLAIIAACSAYQLQQQTRVALLGVAGAACSAIAALVIGTSGSLWGWLRVDLFHYLLALSNLCLGASLFFLFRHRLQKQIQQASTLAG
ncbi:hypothetical protein MIB92_05380 [Aestuariirhabdus sp. Z084]|uniref:hypothetical protein n=1 Tax=Aestuariirhabdus haliotis TaxID=2918751 RepID=UPI00201B35C1|nr:hypothetical protein [Aestuariirhabdus haliotis]MCL6415073.1 hypothetical protein [Aestuariirhabdus haliotis]MCL6419005.1 hypothetical protein [Aestuariirhabdus haliotis]